MRSKWIAWIIGMLMLTITLIGASAIDTSNNLFWYSFDTANKNTTHYFDETDTFPLLISSAGEQVSAVVNEGIDCNGTAVLYNTGVEAIGLQNFTINYWFKNLNTSQTSKGVHGRWTSWLNNGALTAGIFNTPNIQGYWKDQSGTQYDTYNSRSQSQDTWYMYTESRYNNKIMMYENGVNFRNITLDAGDTFAETGYLYLCTGWELQTSAKSPKAVIDEYSWWDRKLTNAEILELYNSGSGYNPYAGSPVNPITTLTFDTPVLEESNASLSVLFQFYNLSNSSTATLYYNGSTYEGAITHVNDSYVFFNTSLITPFTYNNNSAVSLYWEYNFSYNNATSEFGNTSSDTQYVMWNLTKYPRVNITAYDVQNSAYLSNFSINDSLTLSTTTGEVYFYQSSSGDYPLTADAGNLYEVKAEDVTFTSGNFSSYTFNLQPYNSIDMYIRDENTGVIINTTTVTITFSSNASGWTNTTTDGTFFIKDLDPTEYQIIFTASGYSNRTYTVTVGNRTSQTLNAYLANSTSTTLFTVKDIDTGIVLEDVSVTMSRYINGSWQTISSKTTDITGSVQFDYVPLAYYRFFLSKTDYDDYIFYLNPILFSTYDVYMEQNTSINYTQDFDKISLIYNPSSFQADNTTTFTFDIASPFGSLINYGFNLTYPGGFSSNSGSNSIGEQLTASVTIVNATVWDVVTLRYYYTDTLSGVRYYTITLPINGAVQNMTFLANKNQDYGLGYFERVLIITLAVLFIVGIASLIGQPIPGVALGLAVMGYFAYIGFIPIWGVLITMLLGVMVLIWKSGGI